MKRSHIAREIGGALLTVLWVFGVVAVYYVAHKPFAPSNLAAVGQTAAGLGGMGLMVLSSIGLGRRILGYVPDVTGIELLALSAAIGLGALAILALALGLLGWLRSWVLWALTLAGLVTFRDSLVETLTGALKDYGWKPQSRFERLLAAFCGLMLMMALLWALTPPTAWDGLVYHLTGPKLYLATGRVSHPLDLPYLGFPQLGEMLFAWSMGLAGERAAAPIHWFYGLLNVLVLVSAGRRWFGGNVGWLAAAVLFSSMSIVFLAGWPYVDVALLLYATLAFLALMRWSEGEPGARKWLVISGVLIGMALSIKYTALALLPALGMALLLNPSSTIRRPLSAIRSLLLLGGVALTTWSPWLIKNLLLTGNPTYPFFFGGAYWDNWRTWWYDRPGTGLLYTAPWKLLVAPWEATVWSIEGASGYSATIGPLFLALLPLLLLVWSRLPPAQRQWLRAALVSSGVLYGFWLWGVARSALLIQTRLLFPAFGLFALIAGIAVEGLSALPRRPLNLSWLIRAIVVGMLALMLVEMGLGLARERPFSVLLGFESRDDFMARRLGWYYPTLQYLNTELPTGAVVLFLWEPRSYPCWSGIECWPDALLDRWLHTTHLYGADASAIAASWRKQGVTHVLLYRLGYKVIREAQFDPLTEADAITLDELVTRQMTLVKNLGSAYEIYRLESGP